MPMVTYRHGSPLVVDHVPTAAVAAGDVVVTNDQPRVAHSDIPANALGSLAVGNAVYRGVADGAIAANRIVYWNATASKVTLTATGNKRLGVTVTASAADGEPIDFVLAPG